MLPRGDSGSRPERRALSFPGLTTGWRPQRLPPLPFPAGWRTPSACERAAVCVRVCHGAVYEWAVGERADVGGAPSSSASSRRAYLDTLSSTAVPREQDSQDKFLLPPGRSSLEVSKCGSRRLGQQMLQATRHTWALLESAEHRATKPWAKAEARAGDSVAALAET